MNTLHSTLVLAHNGTLVFSHYDAIQNGFSNFGWEVGEAQAIPENILSEVQGFLGEEVESLTVAEVSDFL